MLVVSDTTAVTNLLKIGFLDLMKDLYGQVIIPRAVYDELCYLPEQQNVLLTKDWIIVAELKDRALYNSLRTEIDHGESEAIALAIELGSRLLVIDERKGRIIAKQHGLQIIGVLGVLVQAKKKGLINSLKSILYRLVHEEGFRVHPKLYQQIIRSVGEEE